MGTPTLKIEDGSAQLAGDLTFATVTALYERMQAESAGSGMPATIDLADAGRIDSAGLALLLEWQAMFRKQAASSGLIRINNPPAALLKIARLCDATEFVSGDSGAMEGQ